MIFNLNNKLLRQAVIFMLGFFLLNTTAFAQQEGDECPTFPNDPIVSDTSRCGSGTVTLTASGASMLETYQWYNNAGPIIGATSATYTTPVLTANTTYEVSIKKGTCESAQIPVQVSILGSTVASASNVSRCGAGSVTLTASGSSDAYQWYDADDYPISGATSATYTPTISITTTFKVSAVESGCEGPKTTVTAEVIDLPAPSAANKTLCGPGSVLLVASGLEPGAKYQWYDGTTLVSETGSYSVINLQSTKTFQLSQKKGNCESTKTDVTVTIKNLPSAPSVTTNPFFCGPSNVIIEATHSDPTGHFQWYNSSQGAISDAMTATYNAGNITVNTTFYVSKVDTDGCESALTPFNIVINEVPSVPTGIAGERCGSGTVNLNAINGPVGAYYRWYDDQDVLVQNTTVSAFTTPVLTENKTYYVSVFNNHCESAKVPVVATIKPIPAAPVPTDATVERCGAGSLVLSANGDADTYNWYDHTNTLLSNTPGNSYTTTSLSSSTTFYVSAVKNGCESSKATINVTIKTVPSAPSAQNVSKCGYGEVSLTASGEGTSYQWYDSDNIAINGAISATYTKNIISGPGEGFYVSTIQNGCESAKTYVTATIIYQQSPPSYVSTPSSCGAGTFNIVANGAENEAYYQWYDQNLDPISAGVTGTYDESLSIDVATTTTVYVSIVGACETDKTPIELTVNDLPDPPAYELDTICGPGTLTLKAIGAPDGYTYQWYNPFDGMIENATNATYTTPHLTHSMTYYVTIKNAAGCESVKTAVRAIVQTPPDAPDAESKERCDTGKLTLLAGGWYGAGNYQWYNENGKITDATEKYYETETLDIGTHNYYVTWVDVLGCESEKTKVTATVHPLPVVPTIAENVNSCSGAPVVLTASGASTGESYRWYLEGELIHGAREATYTTGFLKENTNFQVTIFNDITKCESVQKNVLITYPDIERPLKPILISGCEGGSDTLQIDSLDNNSDYNYYWQSTEYGTDETHGLAQFVPTQTGVYYLRAQEIASGCWGRASIGQLAMVNNPNPTGETNLPNGTTATIDDATVSRNSQTDLGNYVRAYDVLQEGVKTSSDLNMTSTQKETANITTAYFDGLGRTIQTVNKAGSPAGKDMIQPYEYDAYGRQAITYLPFVSAADEDGIFKADALQNQHAFYLQTDNNIATSGKAYSETEFDASPFHRVTTSYAPGETWVGSKDAADEADKKNTTYKNRNNNPNEVLNWQLSVSGIPEIANSNNAYYKAGELEVTETTDENKNKTIEYTDKDGFVVLVKRQSGGDDTHEVFTYTYSIYDDHGNLRYVLQPQFYVEYEIGMNINDLLKQHAFQYKYDSRQRLISKEIPGAGMVEMVYDKLDRLVLSRNAVQAQNREWEFTKFDIFNRPVLTGIFEDSTYNDRDYYQELVNNLTALSIDPNITIAEVDGDVLQGDDLRLKKYEGHKTYLATSSVDLMHGWEMRADTPDKYLNANIGSVDTQTGAWVQGYYDQTFPNIEYAQVLTVNYYDNYDFNGDGEIDFEYITGYDGLFTLPAKAAPVFERVKGRKTGSKVRNLETLEWMTTARFFDSKGRVIQTQAENHLGGTDVLTFALNFRGKALQSVLKHITENESKQIIKTYSYDHGGRLLATTQSIDGQKEEQISKLQYNELGEMIKKDLGGGLQEVDYKYNIRGWMTDINDVNVEDTVTHDLFSMQLAYDNGFNMGQYNGNISGVKWKSDSDKILRAYGYHFDALNRLKRADYRADNGTNSWNNEIDHYTTFDINYDANGNILSMARQGLLSFGDDTPNVFGSIDRMGYTYDGNQLIAVDDKISTKTMAKDFKDLEAKYCASKSDEYDYDANGNLIRDDNKKILNISYNYLGLIERIYFEDNRKVEFVYNSLGTKLKKLEKDISGEANEKTMDFVGGIVYNSNKLNTISTKEGAVVPDNDGGFDYQYNIKDHHNRARVSFSGGLYNATIDSENASSEADEFYGLLESQVIGSGIAYKGDGASLLPAVVGGIATYGPQKSIKVKENDKVIVKAFGTYFDGSTPNYTLGTLTGGGVNSGIGEGGIGNIISGVTANNNGQENDGISPDAYLNMLFIPSDDSQPQEFKLYLNGDPNIYHPLIGELEIDREGTLLIYLANESNSDVFFDELMIKHLSIEEEIQYYPFGMKMKGLQPASQSDLKDGDKLKWDDLGFRHYDYLLGRFHAVDPLSELYLQNSSYQYSGNNPINNVDVLGLKKKNKKKGDNNNELSTRNSGSESYDPDNLNNSNYDPTYEDVEILYKAADKAKKRADRKAKRKRRNQYRRNNTGEHRHAYYNLKNMLTYGGKERGFKVGGYINNQTPGINTLTGTQNNRSTFSPSIGTNSHDNASNKGFNGTQAYENYYSFKKDFLGENKEESFYKYDVYLSHSLSPSERVKYLKINQYLYGYNYLDENQDNYEFDFWEFYKNLWKIMVNYFPTSSMGRGLWRSMEKIRKDKSTLYAELLWWGQNLLGFLKGGNDAFLSNYEGLKKLIFWIFETIYINESEKDEIINLMLCIMAGDCEESDIYNSISKFFSQFNAETTAKMFEGLDKKIFDVVKELAEKEPDGVSIGRVWGEVFFVVFDPIAIAGKSSKVTIEVVEEGSEIIFKVIRDGADDLAVKLGNVVDGALVPTPVNGAVTEILGLYPKVPVKVGNEVIEKTMLLVKGSGDDAFALSDELTDAFIALNAAGVDDALIKDPLNLKKINDFFINNPSRKTEVEDALKLVSDKKKFIDELPNKGPGDIIGYKVDGEFLSPAEKKFLPDYKKGGYGDLSDIDAVRKFRDLKNITNEASNLLRKGQVKNDIVRLEKLISKSGNDVSKLDDFWSVTNGSPEKWKKLVDHLDDFKKMPVDLNLKPSYFDNPANEFKDINISHIMDKHTLEHFDFNNPLNYGTSVKMFEPGTTQQQIVGYIDEALNKLSISKGPQYPLDNLAETVQLDNGLTVVIGSQTNELGERVIGQFFPKLSEEVVSFTQDQLLAIKKVLN